MKKQEKSTRNSPDATGSVEFLVGSDRLLDTALRTVKQHSRVMVDPDSDYEMHYLDTFDWRLYRGGWVLYATRNKASRKLVLATRGGSVLQSVVDAAAPAFARNLPPGRLRNTIGSVIEPRRLLARAHMKIHETTVRILNADEKTTARLALQTRALFKPGRRSTATALPSVVRVTPLKGYLDEYEKLVALLENKVGLSSVPEAAFASAVRSAGFTPGGYKAKLTAALQPQMRGDEAVRAIHQSLLDTILANADGVRQNLDPEFLHDYRVAIRATRSVLRQIRGVFPDSEVRHFSKEFNWLGAATGPVRDLDVYLLKMEQFRSELPADMREHLWPLEKYLQVHHDKEQRQLVRTLGSKRYRTLINAWSSFLKNPAPVTAGTCQAATQPAIDLASGRIWSTYQRIWKRGRLINEETPVDELHKLRIECKRLRYLLEFFSSLYAPDEMRALIQTLKQLQTNLGNLNDCEVQRLTLRRIANELHQERLAPADSLLAMGRLMDHLLEEQLDERRRFQVRFGNFSLPENRDRYRDLFKAPAKETN